MNKASTQTRFDTVTKMAILAIAVVAGAIVFFLLRSSPPPDEKILSKRFVRSVEVGWPLLKVSNVQLLNLHANGAFYDATFSYTILIQEEYATLPEAELQRVQRFLPMCVEGFKQGKKDCSLNETMTFVDRQGKGWIPLEMAQRRTDLIDAIIAE